MSATGADKGRWARHRSHLIKLSAAALIAGAVFAAFREDWVFFILLFALLLEAALLFAVGNKGAEPSRKDLAPIVGGFAITSVFVAVVGHLYYRNNQNQELRLAWPWQGMKDRRYLCLRIGDPISIRGYLRGARSLDGSHRSVSIAAEQVYPGSSEAHAAHLREHMPASTWLVFMARTSLLLLALFIGVFINYLVKLIRLWRRRRPDELP